MTSSWGCHRMMSSWKAPRYVMSHALVARAHAGVATLRDLNGQRVAVDAAGVADFYLFYEGFQRGIYRGQERAASRERRWPRSRAF